MSCAPWKTTFGVGARVKVVKQCKYPGEKLLGLVGTVRMDTGSNVSVLLDNCVNPRSSYGCYYFKAAELVEVDESNNEIVKEDNMEKIVNYLNIAKVAYVNDNRGVYHYANFEPDLRPDDMCVVLSEGGKYLVASVLEILEPVEHDIYREVVCKLDTGGYNTRVECREKAAELKKKMEERAKQLQDIALYQMLAKDDSEMAIMLAEYQAIPKV